MHDNEQYFDKEKIQFLSVLKAAGGKTAHEKNNKLKRDIDFIIWFYGARK